MTEDLGINKQIAAIKRELNFRKALYPKWVANGKMGQFQADYQISIMSAVLATLEKCKEKEDAQINLFNK